MYKQAIRDEYNFHKRRANYVKTELDIEDMFTKEEYNKIGEDLLKIVSKLWEFKISFDIETADPDNVSGAFRVHMANGKAVGTFSSTDFHCAIIGAYRNMKRNEEAEKIALVEITPEVKIEEAPKKTISAASIKI
jgi:hypothetical protein